MELPSRTFTRARTASRGVFVGLAIFVIGCSGARDEGRNLDAHPLVLGARGDPPLDPGEALVKGLLRSEETRQPIANVEILLRASGKGAATEQQSALTDAKGHFMAVVSVGHYQLFTSRCDYQPRMVELDASEAAPAQVSLFLAPLPQGQKTCPR